MSELGEMKIVQSGGNQNDPVHANCLLRLDMLDVYG